MNHQCPKCGYVRLSTDTAPSYECPKCGIIYKKYETHLEAMRRLEIEKKEFKREETKKKLAPIIWTKTKISVIKNLISTSSAKARIAYAMISFLLIIPIVFFVNYFLTPEDTRSLRRQYSVYLKSMQSLDQNTSYKYLSTDSKLKVNPYEWNIENKEVSTAVTENIHSIKFSSDGMVASITVERKFDGKPLNLYAQTWVKEGDTWFRDWAHDYPDRVIEIRKKAAQLNNENSKPEIYRIETGFDLDNESFGRIRITPKTTMVIYNNSHFPITYLKIKIDYYDKDKKEILYSAERSVVNDGDASIPRDGKSEVIYANSGVGFVLDMKDINSSAAKHIKDRIDRLFYYKLSYDGRWVRLSTDGLR